MKKLVSVWILMVLVFSSCVILSQSAKPELTRYAPIHINGNSDFASKAASEGWQGDGSAGNPYIIENYDIDTSSDTGIEIENTYVYFIIRNCRIHGAESYEEGIFLNNVDNGQITKCAVYSNFYGIDLCSSSNNKITKCAIYSNSWYGILMDGASNNNEITKCAIYNNRYGIAMEYSSNNEVHYCNIYDNEDYGIHNFDNEPEYSVSATYNWWGSADGPGGEGSGSGDKISKNVVYDSWLMEQSSLDTTPTDTTPTSSRDDPEPWQEGVAILVIVFLLVIFVIFAFVKAVKGFVKGRKKGDPIMASLVTPFGVPKDLPVGKTVTITKRGRGGSKREVTYQRVAKEGFSQWKIIKIATIPAPKVTERRRKIAEERRKKAEKRRIMAEKRAEKRAEKMAETRRKIAEVAEERRKMADIKMPDKMMPDKKMADKKPASRAGAGILILITLIVVLCAVCVWAPWSEEPSGSTGSPITVRTEDTAVSYDDKSIGCEVEDVSSPDVKWDDLMFGVWVDGSNVDACVMYASTDDYVSHGDYISVSYLGFGDGSHVKLKVLHKPTESILLEWSVTCT